MTTLNTAILFVVLCLVYLNRVQANTWTECNVLTYVPLQQPLNDDVMSNRIMTEHAFGLDEGSLKNKEEDSLFMKTINNIILKNQPISFGIGTSNSIKKLEVPVGLKAMCIFKDVPYHHSNLDRNRTEVGNIKHFSKKYVHLPTKPFKGSIFLIQGGPGAGGEALEPMGLKLWKQYNGQYDVIIPDHRGAARSSEIMCVNDIVTEFDLVYCQKAHKYKFDGFTCDDAAMDTITLMRQVKNDNPSGDILLYGVSYGTYVSERIINILSSNSTQPNLIDAVVLDGVCGGDFCDFTKVDEGQESTAMAFFDYCTKDETCSEKLGKTREAILEKLNKVYQTKNQCSSMFQGKLKPLFATFLTDNIARLLIAPYIYRIERCSISDQVAMNVMLLNYAVARLKEMDGMSGYPISLMLNVNIGISELKGRYGNKLKAEKYRDTCSMCTGASALYPGVYSAGYVAYPESKFAKVPSTNIPILLLNGDLDPQTTISSAEKYYQTIQSTTPNSKFLRFPGVVHYVAGRSPMTNNLNENCGFNIIADFFNKKDVNSIDTSCINDLLGVPFGGYEYTNDNIAAYLYDGYGLTKIQYIWVALFVTFIVLLLACCCTCCGLCCCWCARCGPFKKKPVVSTPVVLDRDIQMVETAPQTTVRSGEQYSQLTNE